MNIAAIAALGAVGLFALAIGWLRRTPVEPSRMTCKQIDPSTWDYENDCPIETPAA